VSERSASSTTGIALVTGASRGIGAAIAERLAADGFTVVLAARAEADLNIVSKGINDRGGKAVSLVIDLSAAGAAATVLEFVISRYGRLDVLVTNAGTAKHGRFESLKDDDWLDGFNLKFFAHVRLVRAVWSLLRESQGSLILIAGFAARTPMADFAIGSSVNAAILALMKSLAELGVKDNIQVNAINPGQIRTARLAERIKAICADENVDVAEAEKRIISKNRALRIGEPEDVANTVGFLAGSQGSYLHGSVIDVDGGMTKGL
jgi:NAD(P)-dependent dehydrogenase (short-subunit alcohol dehydrogenase family)